MNRKTGNRIVLGTLICLFSIYNFSIYSGNISRSSLGVMSESALKGEQIWQDNNCTSCHQLYGLGGYLGPDLTNIISHPAKGKNYARAFFNSGVKSMPQFTFSEEEQNHLIDFLSHVDSSGYYPNKKVDFSYSGWVEMEYK